MEETSVKAPSSRGGSVCSVLSRRKSPLVLLGILLVAQLFAIAPSFPLLRTRNHVFQSMFHGNLPGAKLIVVIEVLEWKWEGDDGCGRAQGCCLLTETLHPFPRPTTAVTFRGAPWRATIGRWLIARSLEPASVTVAEPLYAQKCPHNCSGHGVCNQELGVCRCKSSWQGRGCEEVRRNPCNLPATVAQPFGDYMHTMCPDTCDERYGRCVCGSGTKYPGRPILQPPGFLRLPDGTYNHSAVDVEMLYSDNKTNPGWCQMDPQAVAEGKQAPRFEFGCQQDGMVGITCHIPVLQSCWNNCSERGHCDTGFCHCRQGWYGVDCSIPGLEEVQGPPRLAGPEGRGKIIRTGGVGLSKPKWLEGELLLDDSPGQDSGGGGGGAGGAVATASAVGGWWSWGTGMGWVTGGASRGARTRQGWRAGEASRQRSGELVVERKRPLIYVYDLPTNFTTMYLQLRLLRGTCLLRFYNSMNETEWSNDLYSAENALIEDFLSSEHRTTNADEADFFFVPLPGSCMVSTNFDGIFQSPKDPMPSRPAYQADVYRQVYEHISQTYPYWNRTGGKDHLWTFMWDEGACVAPRDIWNSSMLVHWGNSAKYPKSTSAYGADNWQQVPRNFTGWHPCYDPAKDIVVPAWKMLLPGVLERRLFNRSFEERPTLFYFNGNLGPAYKGRPEDSYSWGIRQRVAAFFGSTKDKDGRFGNQSEPGVIVTQVRDDDYAGSLASSRFCGVFPGDGWSGRLEDAILAGCIPVIIQDGIHLPFEHALNFPSFAVRIPENDIANMMNILKAIPEAEVREMLRNVQAIWTRFFYARSYRMEAERQQRNGVGISWEGMLPLLHGDDVFATIIQVLDYKLHNDRWRMKH